MLSATTLQSRLDNNTMALTKTKTAQPSTFKDNVSSTKSDLTHKLLTMFPERPSGVSWADWADDEDEEEAIFEAPSVVEPKKVPQPTSSPPPPPLEAVTINTTKEEGDRIKSHPQQISFDTVVPKPILLNPSMKPNEFGLSASRWASAEPEENDNEKNAKGEEATEAHHETPTTNPEPAEPVKPIPTTLTTTPQQKPKKAAEPGLMASRWAN